MTQSNWAIVAQRFNLTRDSANVRCCCHDDRMASLSIKRKGDDVLLWCHAGCKYEDLARELGLSRASNPIGERFVKSSPVPQRRIIREHVYRDYAGDAIAVKRRWGPDKYFDWVHLGNDGEWRPKLAPNTTQADLPLYRVVEAMGAARDGVLVFLCEGERDADTIHELGLIGACNPEGASQSASAYNMERFIGVFPPGASFCIVTDNDDAGRKHANRLADALAQTFTVSILALPGLPEKEDVSWWVANRRSQGIDDSETASELIRLAAHAMPVIASDADTSTLSDPDTLEAITERAAILADANAWPYDACERIARAQVSARVARERATLTPAQRLALETTDPALRDIYAQLAALSG